MSSIALREIPLGPAATAAPAVDPYAHKYIIAIAVTLAAVLELIDTSIVNVAIPHMMGNLGATLDEISWVSTGYIIANVIVIPMSGWLSGYFGRKRYLTGSIILFVCASFFCGAARSLNAPLHRTGDVVRGVSAGRGRDRPGHVRRGCDGRAHDRAHSRWIHRR
jgi:DHA2 family multidrug resistance protein